MQTKFSISFGFYLPGVKFGVALVDLLSHFLDLGGVILLVNGD
jgi:hypothetical protein